LEKIQAVIYSQFKDFGEKYNAASYRPIEYCPIELVVTEIAVKELSQKKLFLRKNTNLEEFHKEA
jgi:hypothetical protein